MYPELIERVISLRVKILNLELSKIIGEIDKVINKEFQSDKIEFQKTEINEKFNKESENLSLGLEMLLSTNGVKRISDYFILISSLGKIFNSFNNFITSLEDVDSIVEIKKKILKVQKDFYALLFDPLSSTIKYAYINEF